MTETEFWDGIAEKYAAQPVEDVAAFQRKQAITREHLRPSSRVLEIGCGTGSLALAIAPYAGTIDALDVSAEMVRIANQKKHAQGATNVTFRQGSVSALATFERETFDSVWAYSILHLVPDRRHTLEQIFELLKPGGSFISSNVCLSGSWIPYGALITLMRWFGKAPHIYNYDRATLLRELREVGFVEITERDVGAESTVAFVVAKKPS